MDTSPPAVQFDFNEPVETQSGAIRLFDEDGTELQIGEPYAPGGESASVAADISEELDKGVYTATYRVISADGHPVSGGFSFGIGVPVRTEGRTAPAVADLLDRSEEDQPALETVFGAVRGLHYLALLLVIGSVFFRLLVFRGERSWPTQVLFWASLLGLGASAAGLLLQSDLVSGVGLGSTFDSSVISSLFDTKVGDVWGVRVGLWLALMLLFSWRGLPSPLRALLIGALTVGLVATLPSGGHATTHSPEGVLITADVIHVVAAGAWLGALILLLAVYWPRSSDENGEGAGIAATRRFSRLALPAVLILLSAGLLQSWFYLDKSIAELFSSAYGFLLLAKLGLLGGIIALGATNRNRLADAAGSSASSLKKVMRAEVVLAVLVLGVTAALVRSSPPASAGGPETRQLDIGDIRIEMIIEPATTGPNDYHFYLFDRETGAQVRRVKEMTLRLTQPEEDIGPITTEVPYKSPAHYELLGPALSVPGTWEVALDIRLSRFEAQTARTQIEVRTP